MRTRRSSTSTDARAAPVGTSAISTLRICRRRWHLPGPRTWPDLPPAYIAVAGHDPLRDDGARYAELLVAAGVPVELHNAESLVHGYVGYDGVVPAATEAVGRGMNALRDALQSA